MKNQVRKNWRLSQKILKKNKILRDGPLENLWEGGGGRNTKKIFAQGKIK